MIHHKDETMGTAGSSVATTCSTALLACQDIEDDERPGALIQCLSKSGTIDPEKYLLYTEKPPLQWTARRWRISCTIASGSLLAIVIVCGWQSKEAVVFS